MKSYKYTVEGTLLDEDQDFIVEVSRLASNLDIFTKINETKSGYTIVAQGSNESISVFEPQLFRKLATFFNVTKYTKKESSHKKKQAKSSKTVQTRDDYTQKDVKFVAKLLRQSKVLALKQDNGFHIICNASQIKAIHALRKIIKQPDKPLPVVFRSIQKIRQQVQLSKKESELLVTSEHPTIMAKLKVLHRLEKPKYSLSPEINTINQRISVSIRSGNFYKELFNIIDFPIVCMDAIDNQHMIITDKESIIQTYGDNFGSILDIDKDINTPYIRDTIQFVYGKEQLLETNQCMDLVDIEEETLEVCLDLEQSSFIKNGDEVFKFKSYKLLLNKNGMEDPKYTAISVLFSKLSIEKVLSLDLPFSIDEINELYNDWKSDINTKHSNSLLVLFDAVSSLTGILHQKSFVTQCILLGESHFEVCEEGRFDFMIDDKIIDIDIVSAFLDDQSPKHLYCAITNTVSFIIAKIAKEYNLSVNLCGKIFQHRDLIELTIERLEEEDLKVYFR